MPQKSAITRLPQSVRRQLDRLIAEGKLTIDQLHKFVVSCDEVEKPPSRSSVGRYAATIKETSEALRESREIAAGIAQELGADSLEGEQGRLLVEMLRTFAFRDLRRRVGTEEGVDAQDLSRMARAIKDLSQAMHFEQDFAKKIREEERKKVEEEVRGRVQALGSAKDLKELSDEELEAKIAELATKFA